MSYKSRISIDKMIELYQQGNDPEDIAQMYGYKNGEYITTKLKQAKVFKPKRLDAGKVFALYKAGWSIHAIAHEMETTDKKVSEVLSAL